MLTLHAEQMAVFAVVARARFERRLARALRECFVDAATEPKASLLAFVRTQIAKAESYRLQTQANIATYVETAWTLGADFDERFPVLHGLLRAPTVDGDHKARYLAEHTREILSLLRGGR